MKKPEEGQIMDTLQKIEKNLDESLSKELYKMRKITKKTSPLDSKEDSIKKKKDFMEEAETVKVLEGMQKDIKKALSNIGDIKSETSGELVKNYYNALGLEKKIAKTLGKKGSHTKKKKMHKSGHRHTAQKPQRAAPEHLEKPGETMEDKIEEETERKDLQKETGTTAAPRQEAEAKTKEFDLASLKNADTKTLLRKLIEVNIEHQKQIKELLEAMKGKTATFDLPNAGKLEAMPGLEGLKPDAAKNQKAEPEKDLKSAEKEVSIDIPSLKIKDQFSTDNAVQQKGKELDKKKKFLGLFSFEKEPDEKQKLKSLSIDNLKKAAKLGDERKQVVAISYILRQFLEVKFKIPKTLTYSEMVAELQAREIDPYVKTHLIELFTKLPESVYRGTELNIKAAECFDLANRTLQKLADKSSIKRIEIKAMNK